MGSIVLNYNIIVRMPMNQSAERGCHKDFERCSCVPTDPHVPSHYMHGAVVSMHAVSMSCRPR